MLSETVEYSLVTRNERNPHGKRLMTRRVLIGGGVGAGVGIALFGRWYVETTNIQSERKRWDDVHKIWNTLSSSPTRGEVINTRISPVLDATKGSFVLGPQYEFLRKNGINILVLDRLEENDTARTFIVPEEQTLRWYVELSEHAVKTVFTPETLALEILHHSDYIRELMRIQNKYRSLLPAQQLSRIVTDAYTPSTKLHILSILHVQQAERYIALASVLGKPLGSSGYNPMRSDAEEFERCERNQKSNCWKGYIDRIYINPRSPQRAI